MSGLKIKIDLDDPKKPIEIKDFRGTTYIDPFDYMSIIKNQLQMLEGYANDGRVPSLHLLKDIALYKFLLKSPENVEQYFKKKREIKRLIKNYEVGDLLGWDYWKGEK